MEATPFYSSIDYRLPWDAPANAGLFRGGDCYLNPSVNSPAPASEFGISHYSANSNILAANSAVKLSDIENQGNTFLMGELGGDFIPWACPYDWRPLIETLSQLPNLDELDMSIKIASDDLPILLKPLSHIRDLKWHVY
jgi:hypothetical protein